MYLFLSILENVSNKRIRLSEQEKLEAMQIAIKDQEKKVLEQ